MDNEPVAKRSFKKTIISVMLITLFFIGVHTMFNLKIRTMTFSDNWGRSVDIGISSLNWRPLIGQYDGKILLGTYNKDNSMNYYLVSPNGNIINSDRVKIKHFNITKKGNVTLNLNNLLAFDKGNLYLSVYNNNGFTQPRLIMENINDYGVSNINNNTIVYGYSDNKLIIKEINDGKASEILTDNRKWRIKEALFKKIGDTDYIFTIDGLNSKIDKILAAKIVNGKILDFKELDAKKLISGTSVENLQVEELNNNIYLSYSVKQITQGVNNVYELIRIYNKDNLNLISEGKISEENINFSYRLGEDYILYKDKQRVKLLASGINRGNKYALNPDFFSITISKDGTFDNPIFLTNTVDYSIEPSLINTPEGKYLSYLDIVNLKEYKLMINSTNNDFIKNSNVYRKSDYKRAIIRSITAPIYSLSYIFLKGILNAVIAVFAFIFLGLLLRRLDVKREGVKLVLNIIVYIIISYIMFRNNLIDRNTLTLMPKILSTNTSLYIMPLIINLLSAIVTFIFYSENKRLNYFIYVAFFIGIDLYISHILYIPFSLIKVVS